MAIQVKEITQLITEPVTKSQVKAYMGYSDSDTSQDDLIDMLITAARKYVEDYTGCSVVEKQYKVYFEKEDLAGGWLELPFFPVSESEDITLTINGTEVDFEQKGLKRVKIYPSAVYSTIPVGSNLTEWYGEVTFTAGEENSIANAAIIRIVSHLFNHREDGIDKAFNSLPFDTIKLLNSLKVEV